MECLMEGRPECLQFPTCGPYNSAFGLTQASGACLEFCLQLTYLDSKSPDDCASQDVAVLQQATSKILEQRGPQPLRCSIASSIARPSIP